YRAPHGARLIDSAARIAALERVTSSPLADESVSLAAGDSADVPWVFLVSSVRDRNGAAGFLAIDVDIDDLRDRLFAGVFRGANATLLLPKHLAGVTRNRELGEVRVATRGGVELFQSPVRHRSGYLASVPMGDSLGLRTTFELSAAAASSLTRGALPAPDR